MEDYNYTVYATLTSLTRTLSPRNSFDIICFIFDHNLLHTSLSNASNSINHATFSTIKRQQKNPSTPTPLTFFSKLI